MHTFYITTPKHICKFINFFVYKEKNLGVGILPRFFSRQIGLVNTSIII